MAKTKENVDELEDFAPTEESKTMDISFKIPKGMKADSVKAVMRQVERMTSDQMKLDEGVSAGRKKYIEQSKIRYKCIVESNVKGVPIFELIIPSKKLGKPIVVRGQCGVLLEEGLTKHVIDRLQEAHEFVSVEGWSIPMSKVMEVKSVYVSTMKRVKRRLFNVLIYEEVNNPIPLGVKIGKATA